MFLMMNFKMGSKYNETKSRLRKLIQDGTSNILRIPKEKKTRDYACYFCRQQISDDVLILMEVEKKR